jgi:hypothetical protein
VAWSVDLSIRRSDSSNVKMKEHFDNAVKPAYNDVLQTKNLTKVIELFSQIILYS